MASTLEAWELTHIGDSAALLVTELVTNAVVHAASTVVVGIGRVGDVVRISVADESEIAPTRRVPQEVTPGGHGLNLVGRMARSWGHDVVKGGKVVWADISITNHALGRSRSK